MVPKNTKNNYKWELNGNLGVSRSNINVLLRAEQLNMNRETVQQILRKDLEMRKKMMHQKFAGS